MADFNRLMELVTDFGVESLRVGAYEARKAYEGHSLDWKLSMLRDKRQDARERVAKALFELCNAGVAMPALTQQQIEQLARLGCGGDNTRWSFSDAGLRRTIEAVLRAFGVPPVEAQGEDEEMLLGLAEVFACTYKNWWNDRTPENDVAFREARASLLRYARGVALDCKASCETRNGDTK